MNIEHHKQHISSAQEQAYGEKCAIFPLQFGTKSTAHTYCWFTGRWTSHSGILFSWQRCVSIHNHGARTTGREKDAEHPICWQRVKQIEMDILMGIRANSYSKIDALFITRFWLFSYSPIRGKYSFIKFNLQFEWWQRSGGNAFAWIERRRLLVNSFVFMVSADKFRGGTRNFGRAGPRIACGRRHLFFFFIQQKKWKMRSMKSIEINHDTVIWVWVSDSNASSYRVFVFFLCRCCQLRSVYYGHGFTFVVVVIWHRNGTFNRIETSFRKQFAGFWCRRCVVWSATLTATVLQLRIDHNRVNQVAMRFWNDSQQQDDNIYLIAPE